MHRSCPDITSPIDREFTDLSNSNWKYTTAYDRIPPIPPYPKADQAIQTNPIQVMRVVDTGAQHSSPSDSSSSSSSSDSEEVEGTENITVAKRYINRQYSSVEDLSITKTTPNKRFRTSTPEPENRLPAKELEHCPLKEIINHKPAFTVPQTEIIVAPGQRAARANVQRGARRVNAVMAAGRGLNNLQGADPALVQILQMMHNRDANIDNSRKQLLMFSTEKFTGLDKQKAKGHWAEFSKYLDYQVQLGTI